MNLMTPNYHNLQNSNQRSRPPTIEEKNEDQIIEPSIEISFQNQPTRTPSIKLKGKTGQIPDEFKDYFRLVRELKRIKPNLKINTAYLNKNNQLIIKTEDEQTFEPLKTWSEKAFRVGLEVILKQNKHYHALQDVDPAVDVSSNELNEFMKNKYFIDGMLRTIKK